MTKLEYKEIYPPNTLSDFVKRFWTIKNTTSISHNYTVLPDGYFDIVLSLTENKIDKVLQTGFYTTEFHASIPQNTTLFGISFKPLAADYILQLSLSNVLNKHIQIPNSTLELDKISTISFDGWASSLSNLFLQKLSNQKNIDLRNLKLFSLLSQYEGSMTIKEIAAHLHCTTRYLNRYFQSSFGLSLKSYSNILRCKASYKDIKKGKLYPNGNFADQSHFIKEIKKHTGTTPKNLSQNKNDRFIQFSTRSG